MTQYYSDDLIERSKKLFEPYELWEMVSAWASEEKKVRDLLHETAKLDQNSQEYLIALKKIISLGEHIDYFLKFGVLVRLGIYKSDKCKQEDAQ